MLSVAAWFGTGLTFFRELCYLTVVAFQRQGITIIITFDIRAQYIISSFMY